MIGIRSYRFVFVMFCTLFALEAFGQISPRLALPDESPSGTDPGMGVDLSRARKRD
jgi:hypothetical protein